MHANDNRLLGDGSANIRDGRMYGRLIPAAEADCTNRRREIFEDIRVIVPSAYLQRFRRDGMLRVQRKDTHAVARLQLHA